MKSSFLGYFFRVFPSGFISSSINNLIRIHVFSPHWIKGFRYNFFHLGERTYGGGGRFSREERPPKTPCTTNYQYRHQIDVNKWAHWILWLMCSKLTKETLERHQLTSIWYLFFVNFKSTLKSCVVPPKGLKTKNFNKNVKDIYLGANRFVRALINTGPPHYKKSSNKQYPV